MCRTRTKQRPTLDRPTLTYDTARAIPHEGLRAVLQGRGPGGREAICCGL